MPKVTKSNTICKLPKLKVGDLIEVYWRDAGKVCQDATWIELEEINYDECDFDLSGPQTVGYFLKKTEHAIYVCQTYAAGQIINPFSIPLGCIQILEKK